VTHAAKSSASVPRRTASSIGKLGHYPRLRPADHRVGASPHRIPKPRPEPDLGLDCGERDFWVPPRRDARVSPRRCGLPGSHLAHRTREAHVGAPGDGLADRRHDPGGDCGIRFGLGGEAPGSKTHVLDAGGIRPGHRPARLLEAEGSVRACVGPIGVRAPQPAIAASRQAS
jgi:hypothetical protein